MARWGNHAVFLMPQKTWRKTRQLGTKPGWLRAEAPFFRENDEIAEFAVALFAASFGGHRLYLLEVLQEAGLQALCCLFVIAMRPAEGFGYNLVHQTQFEQVLGSDLERFRGFRRSGAILPENRRATFGADDGVIGVFENQNTVSDADAQGTARAALADDGGDHRHIEQHHFAQVHCDGLRNVALLRPDPGVSTGRVNQRDHRQSEFFRQFHEAHRFAIASG